MEGILSLLPAIFCFWTGILIAWGFFAGYKSAAIIHDVVEMGRKVRTSDLAQVVTIAVVTSLLFIVMFVTPQFTAFHMDTILFLEIWYSIFLLYVTENSIRSFEPLKQVKNSTVSVVHFHQKVN